MKRDDPSDRTNSGSTPSVFCREWPDPQAPKTLGDGLFTRRGSAPNSRSRLESASSSCCESWCAGPSWNRPSPLSSPRLPGRFEDEAVVCACVSRRLID
jgi:hypothetical protein